MSTHHRFLKTSHLFQPLDLTTNRCVRGHKRKSFSNYFTTSIAKALEDDPSRDASTIKVDFKLSSLKQLHVKSLREVYEYLKLDKGRSLIKFRFRVAGITKAVQDARERIIVLLEPY